MSKQKNPNTTSTSHSKPTEIQILQAQNSRLVQEYQTVFQQAIGYKELALKNALAVSNLVRNVTGRLLDIESTDETVSGQIKAIIKELNKVEKPSDKTEQPLQDSDPI